MSESEEYWADFYSAICDAGHLIEQQYGLGYLEDRVTMDSVMAELKFLYTFLEYTLASSHNNSTNMDSLFIKVAAAANEFTTHLRRAFPDSFTFTHDDQLHPHQNFITKMVNWWRSAWHPSASKASELLRVFTFLNPKIALLKSEIMAAYRDCSLSTQSFRPHPAFCRTSNSSAWNFLCSFIDSLSALSFHPHPPSAKITTYDWRSFCLCLEWNLQYLSQQESLCLGDPLRRQMKTLQWSLSSLYSLLFSADVYWSPWTENLMAHFGGIVVQIAHFCCLFWYNPPLDQSMEQHMANTLSDLHRKMDPTTPEFLDIALGCLEGHHDGKDFRRSISSFIYYIIGLIETDVLHQELVPLLACLIKVPEMHDMDVHSISVRIKDVVMKVRYLKCKDMRNHTTDLAILFAKIWSLKAEIYIKSSGTLLALSKDAHIEALHQGYRYLKQFFSAIKEKSVEYQILKLIEGIPMQMQSLYQSSHAESDYLLHVEVSNLLFKSHVQIMLLSAEALLLELLEKNASLILPLKHQIKTFHDGLFCLIKLGINQPKEIRGDEMLILTDIEVVASRVISVCDTLRAEKVTGEAVKNMEIWLSEWLEKFQHLIANLGLYFQIPMLNLPKTPGLCFIEFLLQNLRNMLNSKHDSVAFAIRQIETICKNLESIAFKFQDVFELAIEKQEGKDLHTQLVDTAYKVDYVIDLMLDGNLKGNVWQHYLWLCHLSEEIGHIKMQLADFDGNVNYGGVHNVLQSLMPVASQVTTAKIEEVMIVPNDQKEEILGRLTRGTQKRDIVSIVGMPGIGKTTLANNVFCSPSVMCHFQIRAWCHVSHKYKRRDLLLDILSHIITVTDNTHAMSDADLDELLRKKLKGRRYLIIMDDIWSTRPCEDLDLSFPDDSNGSRILLTSRLKDVVSKISDTLPLRPLSEEKSWELLKLKIFRGEECPKELLEVGQEIAKNCQGLPLAIGAIAGLLDRTCGKSQDLWKQAAESVSSRILSDPESQCKKILELSYNHLPDHLKACLLYFGAFLEDKDIPVWRLQWLWIAEGFVQKLKSKSLEDLAENYLMDLVGRSLVIVAKRRSNGKVKACRVHDVVRDLCLLKAKDDRFLHLISANDEPYSSFDGLVYGVLYERFNTSNSRTYTQYRLYFCVDREQFVVSRPSGPFVRSLIFSATTDMSPRCSYDVSFISNNFKCLRVLDLESINMGSSFGKGIELLIHLRYLAVCGDMEFIPPSLSELQNLETLLVKSLKRKVVLPDTIWRMRKLRHVHVSRHAIFTLPIDKNGRSFLLDSLVTLSLPYFSFGEEANEIILKFPNLRKLKCVFSEQTYWVPALESLRLLELLKISCYGKALNGNELKLPSGLKKLNLSNFCPSLNHISEIGRLQNLEVLKLISCAFEGSRWDMTEGEFPKLRYLELDNLNIVHWNACGESLPLLQQLVLRNCKQLEEVPFDFACISTLEKIEVQLCGISVNESVRKIGELEIGGLKIVINNSHSA